MNTAKLKLAIHHRGGSFSDRWMETCLQRKIPFKQVNALNTNIIDDIQDIDGFLWHWVYRFPHETLFAGSILAALEATGVCVFPNTATCWHYDDKVAQKFLLEAIGAPLVKTRVFFNKNDTLEWIQNAHFPKVFKLRKGAGSNQVWKIHDAREAEQFCMKAFGEGFVPVERALGDVKVKLRKMISPGGTLNFLKKIPTGLKNLKTQRDLSPRERGYFYIQDFIPGNKHDTRITIIGNRAFGFCRRVRSNDWRASGSGELDYTPNNVSKRCIEIAFDIASKLKTQSLAFDFIHDPQDDPVLLEISYAFSADAVYNCPGHWDKNLDWIEEQLYPQDAILDDLLTEIGSS